MRLKSLRVSAGFRGYVLDQLAGVTHVLARPMFGGVGLYADGVFFGLIAADRLYFKVDDASRPRYRAAGMQAFQPLADKPASMSYYEVPVAILESADDLTAWARAALRAAAKKTPRPRRRASLDHRRRR